MLDAVLFIYALLFSGLGSIPGLAVEGTVTRYNEKYVKSVDDDKDRMYLQSEIGEVAEPKQSPKGNWMFKYQSTGFGRQFVNTEYKQRFRIFTHTAEDKNKFGDPAGLMFLRLWDYSVQRIRLDHNVNYYLQTVDVYMTNEGKAGGEQLFDKDPFTQDQFGKPWTVNTIYIYDLPSFTDPLEMAREIAHEYGHALLPAFGIYKGPEDWANGDIGERIYMKWLYQDMVAGKLTPEDVMQAKKEQLASYVSTKVDPLVKQSLLNGLDVAALADRTEKGYNALLAASVYAQAVLPKNKVGRALILASATKKSESLYKSIIEAASETEEFEIQVTKLTEGKPIWIPLGKGTVKGAKVLANKDGYAKVQPTAQIIQIKNPPLKP